jgi:flavodoxin
VNTAVIYYSQSGQTRKIAEAIAAELPDSPTPVAMQEAAVPEPGTLVFFGLPIEQHGPAKPAAAYLQEHLVGHRVALFVTHAAPEGMPELDGWLDGCREAAAASELAGCFDCQCELAAPVKQYMLASGVPELRAWAERDDSQGQPDEGRLERARAFARQVVEGLRPEA